MHANGVGERAVGDQHVLRRPTDASAVQATPRLQTDGVVAGVDVATFDADSFARIHVDPVPPTANRYVLDRHIGTVRRMRRPVAALGHRKSFPANVVAVDRLQHDDAPRILRRGHRRISLNPPRTDDPRVVDVARVNQRAPPRLPTSFPADVHHRIVGCIRAADDHAVLLEPEHRAVTNLHAADQIFARGNDDFATSVNRAGIERFLKRHGIFRCAVASRAKVTDVVTLHRCDRRSPHQPARRT